MHCEMNLTKKFLKKKIRKHLWLTANPRKEGKMMKLVASYVLFDKEFEVFASTIERLKTPLGYNHGLSYQETTTMFSGIQTHRK
jgi:hypothetical protein